MRPLPFQIIHSTNMHSIYNLLCTVRSNMNKIKERRKEGAVCPKCKSPDYKYNGRANSELDEYWQENGKHEFECNSCGHHWQYGKTESIYTQLM